MAPISGLVIIVHNLLLLRLPASIALAVEGPLLGQLVLLQVIRGGGSGGRGGRGRGRGVVGRLQVLDGDGTGQILALDPRGQRRVELDYMRRNLLAWREAQQVL